MSGGSGAISKSSFDLGELLMHLVSILSLAPIEEKVYGLRAAQLTHLLQLLTKHIGMDASGSLWDLSSRPRAGSMAGEGGGKR